MNWTELLKTEIESSYATTQKLVALVDPNALDWKPATGTNWMTVGQLLMHLTQACGPAFRGFVTQNWGLADGVDVSKLKPEEMLPPAEKLPAIASVAEATRLIEEDRRLALEMVAACDENRLAYENSRAPWDSKQLALGHRLLQMVEHLKQHKGQLFYYLKLQGKAVSTFDLWGA